jgi:hypothetical protein
MSRPWTLIKWKWSVYQVRCVNYVITSLWYTVNKTLKHCLYSLHQTYDNNATVCWRQSKIYTRSGRSGDRFPGGEARIFPRVQTSPGAHPTFYTILIGSFPESNQTLRGDRLRSNSYLGLSTMKREVLEGTQIHIQTDRQLTFSITAFIFMRLVKDYFVYVTKFI